MSLHDTTKRRKRTHRSSWYATRQSIQACLKQEDNSIALNHDKKTLDVDDDNTTISYNSKNNDEGKEEEVMIFDSTMTTNAKKKKRKRKSTRNHSDSDFELPISPLLKTCGVNMSSKSQRQHPKHSEWHTLPFYVLREIMFYLEDDTWSLQHIVGQVCKDWYIIIEKILDHKKDRIVRYIARQHHLTCSSLAYISGRFFHWPVSEHYPTNRARNLFEIKHDEMYWSMIIQHPILFKRWLRSIDKIRTYYLTQQHHRSNNNLDIAPLTMTGKGIVVGTQDKNDIFCYFLCARRNDSIMTSSNTLLCDMELVFGVCSGTRPLYSTAQYSVDNPIWQSQYEHNGRSGLTRGTRTTRDNVIRVDDQYYIMDCTCRFPVQVTGFDHQTIGALQKIQPQGRDIWIVSPTLFQNITRPCKSIRNDAMKHGTLIFYGLNIKHRRNVHNNNNTSDDNTHDNQNRQQYSESSVFFNSTGENNVSHYNSDQNCYPLMATLVDQDYQLVRTVNYHEYCLIQKNQNDYTRENTHPLYIKKDDPTPLCILGLKLGVKTQIGGNFDRTRVSIQSLQSGESQRDKMLCVSKAQRDRSWYNWPPSETNVILIRSADDLEQLKPEYNNTQELSCIIHRNNDINFLPSYFGIELERIQHIRNSIALKYNITPPLFSTHHTESNVVHDTKTTTTTSRKKLHSMLLNLDGFADAYRRCVVGDKNTINRLWTQVYYACHDPRHDHSDNKETSFSSSPFTNQYDVMRHFSPSSFRDKDFKDFGIRGAQCNTHQYRWLEPKKKKKKSQETIECRDDCFLYNDGIKTQNCRATHLYVIICLGNKANMRILTSIGYRVHLETLVTARLSSVNDREEEEEEEEDNEEGVDDHKSMIRFEKNKMDQRAIFKLDPSRNIAEFLWHPQWLIQCNTSQKMSSYYPPNPVHKSSSGDTTSIPSREMDAFWNRYLTLTGDHNTLERDGNDGIGAKILTQSNKTRILKKSGQWSMQIEWVDFEYDFIIDGDRPYTTVTHQIQQVTLFHDPICNCHDGSIAAKLVKLH